MIEYGFCNGYTIQYLKKGEVTFYGNIRGDLNSRI